MIDATDVKAHPTASSLNKGRLPRLIGGAKGGMTSKRPVVCDRHGRAVRLYLSAGQCRDCTGAAVLLSHLPGATAWMTDKGMTATRPAPG